MDKKNLIIVLVFLPLGILTGHVFFGKILTGLAIGIAMTASAIAILNTQKKNG